MRAPVQAFAACAAALAIGAASCARGAAPDPKAGEAIYSRCAACHALAYDRTGPRHCGLFGRRAGSVPGFDYFEGRKRGNIIWNEKTFDRFLANRVKAVRGTAMGYAGIASATERADLIAYLKQ